jgi:hypothetical protein
LPPGWEGTVSINAANRTVKILVIVAFSRRRRFCPAWWSRAGEPHFG